MRTRLTDIVVPAFAALALFGCSSTEDALQPKSADVEAAQAAASTTGATTVSTGDSVRFTPVIGAPIEAVTPLSRQLAAEARKRGIAIHPASEPGGDHILKGYLSAFNDGTRTSVIFVWDVLDPAGNRLHRIQGQESVPGAADEPWSSVPAATMERVATRVFDDYQAWLAERAAS